jgi:hypothetical protein
MSDTFYSDTFYSDDFYIDDFYSSNDDNKDTCDILRPILLFEIYILICSAFVFLLIQLPYLFCCRCRKN